MFASLRLAAAAAAVVFFVGCVKYPVIKPEAFNPKPKMAIIHFHAGLVGDATLGLPIKVEGIDDAHAAFSAALASQYELVSVETIRSCQKYFQLQKPTIATGSVAKGLEHVILSKDNVPGLAECMGADVVVSVTGEPKVEAGMQIAGMGTSKIAMTTRVHAWNNAGEEIWKDFLTVKSETFPVAGKVMDPRKVSDAATQALTKASTDAVQRFTQKLAAAPAAATAPAPASTEPVAPAADDVQ